MKTETLVVACNFVEGFLTRRRPLNVPNSNAAERRDEVKVV